MPTLYDLLTHRLHAAAAIIRPSIPLNQLTEYDNAASRIELELNNLIKRFLAEKAIINFCQEIKNQIATIVCSAFRDSNLSLLKSNVSSERYLIILNEFKKRINSFFSGILYDCENYILLLNSDDFNVCILRDILNETLSNKRFPTENFCTEFDNGNDIYLYVTLLAIVEKIYLDISRLNYNKLHLKIANEDVGADIKSKDALILNALLMLNEIDLNLLKNESAVGSQHGAILDVAMHYFFQFSLRLKNPTLLYGVSSVFEDECREYCSSLMPSLIYISPQSSRVSTPNVSPRLKHIKM